MRIKAIHQAVVDDDLPTMKQLVDSFEMATSRDAEGRTPLHLGVLFNREEICRYLLLLYPDCVDMADKVKKHHVILFLKCVIKNNFYEFLQGVYIPFL